MSLNATARPFFSCLVSSLRQGVSRPIPGISLLLLFALVSNPIFGQVFPEYPDDAHWPYGPSNAVEARTIAGQDLIFYGEGTVFRIADVTDRANPIVIGEVATNYAVRGIDISDDGSLAAVADREKWVTLIDLSGPNAPVIAGRYAQADGQSPYAVAFASNDLLIAAISPAGVWALDVSNPSAITIAGTYFEPGTDFVFDVEVYQSLAIVADDLDGVSLVDFSDLGDMQLVDRNSDARATRITLVDDRIYAAGLGDGLSVLDIDTTGASPVLDPVGALDTSGFPAGFPTIRRVEFLEDGTAVLADQTLSNGLIFADIDNLAAPTIIGNDRGGRIDVAAIGGTAVSIKLDFFHPSVVELIDESSDPVASSAIPHFSNSVNVSFAGNELVVANGEAGVLLMNLSGQSADLTTDFIPVPGGGVRDAVRVGDSLVVITSGDEIDLVDISDPAEPVFALPFDLGGGASSFDAHPIDGSSWVAVTAGILGVQIIDVANPFAPQLVTSWAPDSGSIIRVFADNDRLIAASSLEAWILSLDRNQETLSELGTLSTDQQINDVHIEGDRAFLAATINGMEIWDISNPALPSFVSRYNPFPIFAHGIAVMDETAYIASDTFYGLMAVDIADPLEPELIDIFNSPGNARKVVVNDEILAMADLDMGVRIWSNIVEDGLFRDRFELIMSAR